MQKIEETAKLASLGQQAPGIYVKYVQLQS